MAMEMEESDDDQIVPWEVLRPRIAVAVKSEHLTVLHHHMMLARPKSRVDQMKCIYEGIGIHFRPYATYRNVAPIFQLKKSRFATLVKKPADWKPAATEHFKFPPEQEAGFVTEVLDRYSKGSPFTPSVFIRWVKESTGVDVTDGYIPSFLGRQLGQIQKGIASPLEAKRYTVEQEYVDAYVQDLFEFVQGIPTCLLFNAEESGIDEYVDAKRKHVLAPATADPSHLVYSVQRKPNHITLLPLINFSDGNFCQFIVTRRRTTDADVFTHGLRRNIDLRLEYSETGYMTTELFLLWAREIFFPSLVKVRAANNTGSAWAVLIVDGFRGHTNTELLAEMEANGVHLVLLPPHSSHALQPFDLTTFSGLKRLLRRYNAESDLGVQATLIHRIVHACQDSTTMHKNISAFERAGFLSDSSNPLPLTVINVPKLKEQIALLHAKYPDDESESDSSSSSS
jgi:hypothetical protein